MEPLWLDQAVARSFRTWLDSEDGFPDGGSGPGLAYTEDDMEAAFKAGYQLCQDEQ